MTHRIYKPGEVDDEAYGPLLEEAPLPKWRPGPGAEQEHFVQWCLAKLEDVSDTEELEAAMRELQADTEAEEAARDIVEQPIFEKARELMPLLTRDVFRLYRHGPPAADSIEPDKGGRPGDTKIAAARIDNARLTVLFKRHFGGKSRRPCRPSRLEILKARHDLTEEQVDTLENYLS